MAVAPKKTRSTPAKKAPRKPRLSRTEAETRILHATVKLLQVHAPADVTVHMIAAEAGVHHDYIARYFTSREELLIQVTEIPMTGDIIEVEATQGKKLLESASTSSAGFQLATHRIHLIAYLLACGVDPERFTETQEQVIRNTMDLFTKAELTDRSKRNFSLISILLMQSIALMSDVNGMTAQDKEDISTFIIGMGAITPLAQTSFGWDKPAKSAPKKRK